MKMKYKDSIFEKIVDFFWYDCKLWKAKDVLFIDIPNFLKNIWFFRKELCRHQWWDYTYTLEMLHRSLVIMESKMHSGKEIRETRDKKIQKMQRAITILESMIEHDYIERAEEELGKIHIRPIIWEKIENEDLYKLVDDDTLAEKRHATKVYKRARQIENKEWKELWDILKGKKFTNWDHYDGGGLNNWWD